MLNAMREDIARLEATVERYNRIINANQDLMEAMTDAEERQPAESAVRDYRSRVEAITARIEAIRREMRGRLADTEEEMPHIRFAIETEMQILAERARNMPSMLSYRFTQARAMWNRSNTYADAMTLAVQERAAAPNGAASTRRHRMLLPINARSVHEIPIPGAAAPSAQPSERTLWQPTIQLPVPPSVDLLPGNLICDRSTWRNPSEPRPTPTVTGFNVAPQTQEAAAAEIRLALQMLRDAVRDRVDPQGELLHLHDKVIALRAAVLRIAKQRKEPASGPLDEAIYDLDMFLVEGVLPLYEEYHTDHELRELISYHRELYHSKLEVDADDLWIKLEDLPLEKQMHRHGAANQSLYRRIVSGMRDRAWHMIERFHFRYYRLDILTDEEDCIDIHTHCEVIKSMARGWQTYLDHNKVVKRADYWRVKGDISAALPQEFRTTRLSQDTCTYLNSALDRLTQTLLRMQHRRVTGWTLSKHEELMHALQEYYARMGMYNRLAMDVEDTYDPRYCRTRPPGHSDVESSGAEDETDEAKKKKSDAKKEAFENLNDLVRESVEHQAAEERGDSPIEVDDPPALDPQINNASHHLRMLRHQRAQLMRVEPPEIESKPSTHVEAMHYLTSIAEFFAMIDMDSDGFRGYEVFVDVANRLVANMLDLADDDETGAKEQFDLTRSIDRIRAPLLRLTAEVRALTDRHIAEMLDMNRRIRDADLGVDARAIWESEEAKAVANYLQDSGENYAKELVREYNAFANEFDRWHLFQGGAVVDDEYGDVTIQFDDIPTLLERIAQQPTGTQNAAANAARALSTIRSRIQGHRLRSRTAESLNEAVRKAVTIFRRNGWKVSKPSRVSKSSALRGIGRTGGELTAKSTRVRAAPERLDSSVLTKNQYERQSKEPESKRKKPPAAKRQAPPGEAEETKRHREGVQTRRTGITHEEYLEQQKAEHEKRMSDLRAKRPGPADEHPTIKPPLHRDEDDEDDAEGDGMGTAAAPGHMARYAAGRTLASKRTAAGGGGGLPGSSVRPIGPVYEAPGHTVPPGSWAAAVSTATPGSFASVVSGNSAIVMDMTPLAHLARVAAGEAELVDGHSALLQMSEDALNEFLSSSPIAYASPSPDHPTSPDSAFGFRHTMH